VAREPDVDLLELSLRLMRPLIAEAAGQVGDDRVAQFKWAIARLAELRPEDRELRETLAALRAHPGRRELLDGLKLPEDLRGR
jgi:hypothetical protein